ncbi:MAG TPA: tripartite tricarboxylate transporter substrate-binding protein, partial [Burkholderiales bacterium]|nr:tripartite tricarboxylate transporter substrate-binding protein [Burkholderiales bacterium]
APTHLAAELFKAMAGVDMVRIAYKGTGPAINALLGGQVQLMFVSTTSVAPHVKSGKLKALAVSTAQPSALAPGLPTMSATGLPGYEATSLFGMFAPAHTPAAIIGLLNREIVQVLNRTEVKERLFNSGVEPIGSSPAELAATMKSEMAKWGKLIKSAGIREE